MGMWGCDRFLGMWGGCDRFFGMWGCAIAVLRGVEVRSLFGDVEGVR
ncbi:hypothetical protein [Dolichospermum compactum]|nr:hypothetical protein [Dolichospermum compactum]